jgi:Fe-S-cluster-containing hydrogenase component 2
LGLFTNAIGDGRKIALNIDLILSGNKPEKFEKAPVIPRDRVKTEFYQGMNLVKVESMEAQEEKERCLSCGLCRDCEFCMNICPEQAINRISKPDGSFEYVSDPQKCIGCGICAGVCPCGIWTMHNNFEKYEEA